MIPIRGTRQDGQGNHGSQRPQNFLEQAAAKFRHIPDFPDCPDLPDISLSLAPKNKEKLPIACPGAHHGGQGQARIGCLGHKGAQAQRGGQS
jgi:hypothetical protein